MKLPQGITRILRLDPIRHHARRELDDELRHHFDEAVEGYLCSGLGRDEALARARARFGDEKAYRKALMTIDDGRMRTMRGTARLDAVVRTVSSALRGLRRNPWLTGSVVSILGLGIGANAVMFGVVDRLLLSPPQHIVEADDVRLIHVRRAGFNGEIGTSRTVTWPDYQDFIGVGAFASVAGFTSPQTMTIGRGDAAGRVDAAGASASLFPLLGVQPALGRFFVEEEDRIGADPTAVLAHEFWEREFGSDPEVVGRSVDIGQGSYTIIGVAPPGFTGAALEPVDVWLPIMVFESFQSGDGWVDSRGWYWLHTVVRMADGSTVEAAAAEATAAHRSGRADLIAEDRYDENAEVLVAPVIAARGPRPSEEARVAGWLAGVSLAVLLIACFNVANLLLARAVRARREIAVRLTLGVGRGRLVAELLAESFALAALGATAAVVVAALLGDVVHQALLPDVAFTDVGLGARLALFTGVAVVFAGLVTGLFPALQATRTDLAETMRSGGRTVAGGRSRTRVLLLVGQAALSVVLLVGAGLFVRSLGQAEGLDLGFDSRQIAVVALEWNETLPGDDRTAIYGEVLQRVRRLPGVSAAALSYTVPFRSSISIGRPRVPGLDSIPRHANGGPYANKVGSGYFEAMGLHIIRGRAIEPRDDGTGAPPVAVISESMADAIWPDGGEVGSCMMLGDEPDTPCTEVVGVVENHRREAVIEDDPHFLYYLNQDHPAFRGPPQAIMAGVAGDPRDVLGLLRQEARAVSSQIRFVDAVALREYIEPQLRSWRLGASMFTVFGLLALLVAAWGLYSVLAFDVALRGHEIGIRAALGADRSRVVRLVLRQALVLVGAGTLLGMAAAAGLSRFMEPLLFRVSGTDPTTYATVSLTLMAVAALAGALPAWRATRIDPREALQAD